MVLYVKVEEDSKNGIVCKSGGYTISFLLSSSTFTYNTILTVFLHFYIQYHSYCLPLLDLVIQDFVVCFSFYLLQRSRIGH
jgi:hypothetical protein